MSHNTYLNLRLFLIVFLTSAFVLGWVSYAKGQAVVDTATEKVEQVQQQVDANNVQIDTTTAATVGGIALGGIALGRELLKSKSQDKVAEQLKQEDRKTDRDVGLTYLKVYRLIQTMDAFIPAVTKCLDQPFNSDPMAKDITIRKKLSEDATEWAEYLMTTLNTTIPSMTPSAAVIVADAGLPPPPTPPKPPAPAATTNNTTTNTTVGK